MQVGALMSIVSQVKVVDGEIAITNLHVGSLGDILTFPIDVDPDLNMSKIQLMDAIMKELSADGFTESDASDFWSDFDNLQKAHILPVIGILFNAPLFILC